MPAILGIPSEPYFALKAWGVIVTTLSNNEQLCRKYGFNIRLSRNLYAVRHGDFAGTCMSTASRLYRGIFRHISRSLPYIIWLGGGFASNLHGTVTYEHTELKYVHEYKVQWV